MGMAMGKDETWRDRDGGRDRDTDSSEAWLMHQPLIVALPPRETDQPAPNTGRPEPDADQPELEIDWPDPDPNWPIPDPNVFDEDSYHPPDWQRRTFAGHAAGPTLCRVGWMVFDSNTPAGNETEDSWGSVDAAYEMLPRSVGHRDDHPGPRRPRRTASSRTSPSWFTLTPCAGSRALPRLPKIGSQWRCRKCSE